MFFLKGCFVFVLSSLSSEGHGHRQRHRARAAAVEVESSGVHIIIHPVKASSVYGCHNKGIDVLWYSDEFHGDPKSGAMSST